MLAQSYLGKKFTFSVFQQARETFGTFWKNHGKSRILLKSHAPGREITWHYSERKVDFGNDIDSNYLNAVLWDKLHGRMIIYYT